MKTFGAPVEERELHECADGWLEGERRVAVIDYLGAHPEATVRVLSWQRQSLAIRQAFALPPAVAGDTAADNILPIRRAQHPGYVPRAPEHPLPARRGERLRPVTHGQPYGMRLARSFGASALVAVGMFIGAVTLIYSASGLAPLNPAPKAQSDAAAAPAFAAWRALALAQDRLPPGQPRLSAYATAWLAGPASLVLRAPGATESYDFTGARRAGGELLLTYQSGGGKRLALTLTPAETTANSALRLQKDRDLSLVSWSDGGVAYALVGPLEGDVMLRLARGIYGEISARK